MNMPGVRFFLDFPEAIADTGVMTWQSRQTGQKGIQRPSFAQFAVRFRGQETTLLAIFGPPGRSASGPQQTTTKTSKQSEGARKSVKIPLGEMKSSQTDCEKNDKT
jgi:hypothetical protein